MFEPEVGSLGQIPCGGIAEHIICIVDYETGIHAGFLHRTAGSIISGAVVAVGSSVEVDVDRHTPVGSLLFGAFAEQGDVGIVPFNGVDSSHAVGHGHREVFDTAEILAVRQFELAGGNSACGQILEFGEFENLDFRLSLGGFEVEHAFRSQRACNFTLHIALCQNRFLGI